MISELTKDHHITFNLTKQTKQNRQTKNAAHNHSKAIWHVTPSPWCILSVHRWMYIYNV